MTMEEFFAPTQALLRSAALVAKKRGLGDLQFTWSDLGDLYRSYGVNATGAKFVDMLSRRAVLNKKPRVRKRAIK